MKRPAAWLLMTSGLVCSMSFSAVPPSNPPVPTSGSRPCDATPYRQLDFRLGSFNVTTGSDVQAGRSNVESILDGCALVEHWTGAVSGAGQAVFAFDRNDRRWHMTFVNSAGNQLHLSGTFVADALVLEGENWTFEGRRALHRMTWSKLPPGDVRQLWEISADGGSTWQEYFEGRYVRLP